mgnify:FL=1
MSDQKPAAGPRRVRIYNPQLDRVRVGSNESCGVHKPPFKSYELDPSYWDNFTEFIEVSAYSQLAEQLERYKGMWESECERGNRHLDKFMQSERELEQARKERDRLAQILHEGLADIDAEYPCENHDMEPNTTMDFFRCDKCGIKPRIQKAQAALRAWREGRK